MTKAIVIAWIVGFFCVGFSMGAIVGKVYTQPIPTTTHTMDSDLHCALHTYTNNNTTYYEKLCYIVPIK